MSYEGIAKLQSPQEGLPWESWLECFYLHFFKGNPLVETGTLTDNLS